MEGLKLKGMAECYKALQTLPVNEWPTLDMFVAHLAEAENQYRNQRRTEMYLKTSKLRYNTWTLCNFLSRHVRNLHLRTDGDYNLLSCAITKE